MRSRCVKETHRIAPKSSGFEPVSDITRSAAFTQRSTTVVPSAAIRRVIIPVASATFASFRTAFFGRHAQMPATLTPSALKSSIGCDYSKFTPASPPIGG